MCFPGWPDEAYPLFIKSNSRVNIEDHQGKLLMEEKKLRRGSP